MVIAFVNIPDVPSVLRARLGFALLTVAGVGARTLAAIRERETSFSVPRE